MKGILFKPEMIKAIVEGRKTVTRRTITRPEQWTIEWNGKVASFEDDNGDIQTLDHRFAKYYPGETVYIKEAVSTRPDNGQTMTRREYDTLRRLFDIPDIGVIFKSALFMKQSDARYFICIKSVRPERLQEITEQDAVLEGCEAHIRHIVSGIGVNPHSGSFPYFSARMIYKELWDSINDKVSPAKRLFTLDDKSNRHFVKNQHGEFCWAKNPWVWRIEFELVTAKKER